MAQLAPSYVGKNLLECVPTTVCQAANALQIIGRKMTDLAFRTKNNVLKASTIGIVLLFATYVMLELLLITSIKSSN